MARVEITHFTDPGCPWAYSARPALVHLRWRYGDQLVWRRVLIGLAEHASQYEERGYTALGSAIGRRRFRPYGMPFGTGIKLRQAATSLACRVVVATRLRVPDEEERVFLALQLAQFCTLTLLDEPEDLRAALAPLGHEGLVALAEEDPDVLAAYERDRAEARTAAGSATEFQGKHAATDGPVRYTAPSLIFKGSGGAVLEAGGWQPVEAYDVLLANLDRTLERRDAPDDVVDILRAIPEGVTTQDVTQVLRSGNDEPDRATAEQALLTAVDAGRARCTPVGDDALWTAV